MPLSAACALLSAILLGPGISRLEAQAFEVLHGFSTPPSGPNAEVIEGSDGLLYGTSSFGGTYGEGTIFKVSNDGSGLRKVHDFNFDDGAGPSYGGLLEATDGILYGTTAGGGLGYGVVFKVNKDGTGFLKLHVFSGNPDGINPSGRLLEGTDGALYGTTPTGGLYSSGIVFTIRKDGAGFLKLHDFKRSAPADGAYPYGGVIEGADGFLYGTAQSGGLHDSGVVFRISKDGTGFLKLHDFDLADLANGAIPESGLLEGTDGCLYGTTHYGGPNGGSYGDGIVFKINTDGTGFQRLHDFAGADGAGPWGGLVEGSDGVLSGTTLYGGTNNSGTVFRIGKDGTGFSKLHDFVYGDPANGAFPRAGVAEGSDGMLYGTTNLGGSDDGGIVFGLNRDGTDFRKLTDFGYSDGARPTAGLLEATDGGLYGTTYSGGEGGYGIVFKIDKNGGELLKLHDFSDIEGVNPQAGLAEGSDGALYGTTFLGGDFYSGIVFKINKDGSAFSKLHDFNSLNDGGSPMGNLVEGSDGSLYGTTGFSGPSGHGTVFKINEDGTGFLRLYSFSGGDGGTPTAGLVEGSDGTLYGTTREGGAYGQGTVFSIHKDGTGFLTLWDFHAGNFSTGNGANPEAGLTEGTDDALYGTTSAGGAFGSGIVFRMKKDGSAFRNLHDFNGADLENGSDPKASLVEGSGGWLYGTTFSGGAYDYGIAFKVKRDGTGFVKLHDFNSGDTANGANPTAGLLRGSDGAFYGTTSYGGPDGTGAIYRLTKSHAIPQISSPTSQSRKRLRE